MSLNAGNSSLWYSDWTGIGNIGELVDFVHISDTQLTINQLWRNGTWDLNNISTALPHDVKDVILNIPIPTNPNSDTPDRWVWNSCQAGTYSAGGGYRWLLNNN